MSDVFVSYARSTERQAHQVADALRTAGYDVWQDDQLPAHRSYAEVIEERLKAAKAVVVVWSLEAIASLWVRAEADMAREVGTLVQLTVDGTMPPMPFNQIQCADLRGWDGETDAPGWQKVESSIASLTGGPTPGARPGPSKDAAPKKVSVCVLPFENMSGDPEQEYFSDGISEDIITDLSKISALSVIARNTAFRFKGKEIDVKAVATELAVSHVLEGSVRKAGPRVRITAQLIDGRAGDHVWAERYDRELTDIFDIQDEISKAIADALKLRLLPKEKKAIEQRGTNSADAYNLYLMARQHWITGNVGDVRRDEVSVRICKQAIAIDQDYAKAWALMALAQAELRFRHGKDVDPLPAAERALKLDPNLAEAHCVKARYLQEEGRDDEASELVETALDLDPESFEANKEAGRLKFRQGHIEQALHHFAKAASLMDGDYHDTGMLITCYQALGDAEGVQRAAQMTQERAEKAVAQDASNGAALGYGACALAVMGDRIRAREWIDRALMIDPENNTMRYNLACSLANYLKDGDAAIELLGPYFERVSVSELKHCGADPDMDPVRDDPRFKAMADAARARLAGAAPAEVEVPAPPLAAS
ncbi:MAG TPA: TIR domain-containing protein [Sphingomicrobium sp.]|nr:TIR domain-containing protein [Sphingomicrobium sp.]